MERGYIFKPRPSVRTFGKSFRFAISCLAVENGDLLLGGARRGFPELEAFEEEENAGYDSSGNY